ncbi:MAG: 30S ribosome-binding factor RbfA [Planctomycetaceae bacterium]
MSRRTAKVSEAIREIVSTTILFDLKDPRVKNVTVLWVDAAPDLRSARVFISVRGEPKEQTLTLHGLNSARGYVQSQIADKLDLRYTPILQFVLDPGARQAAEISSLLRSAMEQTNRSTAGEAAPGDEAEAGEDHGSDAPGDDGDGIDDSDERQVEPGAQGDLSEGSGPGAVPLAGLVTAAESAASAVVSGTASLHKVAPESGGQDLSPFPGSPVKTPG